MKNDFFRIGIAAAAFLCTAAQIFASPVGSVAGTVKDATGAVIPHVKLTLTNTSTNSQITMVSNPEGEFQFLQLAPATYRLIAEAPGLKRASASSALGHADH